MPSSGCSPKLSRPKDRLNQRSPAFFTDDYLYVAIDRTSKFAFVQLVSKTGMISAAAFLGALIAAVPYKIHTVLTDGIQFTFSPRYADGPEVVRMPFRSDSERRRRDGGSMRPRTQRSPFEALREQSTSDEPGVTLAGVCGHIYAHSDDPRSNSIDDHLSRSVSSAGGIQRAFQISLALAEAERHPPSMLFSRLHNSLLCRSFPRLFGATQACVRRNRTRESQRLFCVCKGHYVSAQHNGLLQLGSLSDTQPRSTRYLCYLYTCVRFLRSQHVVHTQFPVWPTTPHTSAQLLIRST